MRKSNFGSTSSQRHSVLKPRNAENTPNSRHSSGLRKIRGSSEGNMRLSQVGRITPIRSNIPRYTPVRNNAASTNALLAPPSASRMSADSMRNSSMGGKNRKETRPIGDTAFKSECIDKILEFLACNGFDYQINRRSLLNPSTKDFVNMFNFVYRHFDPSYTLPHKFEEEIPRLMKLLKYPSQLTKSTFITVGSRHTWPTVLAMMAWMIHSLGVYSTTDGFSYIYPSDFDVKSAVSKVRVNQFFDFYKHRDNQDMLTEQCEEYNHTIEKLYEVRVQDIIEAQELSEKFDNEIARASSGPERVEHLNKQFEQLVNDKEKMICYNKELQVHLTAKDTERAQLESKQTEHKAEILQVGEEQIRLEAIKGKQALSVGELARFKNHAKDVAALISQLQAQGKELDTQIWTNEMTLGKAQKELSENVSNYNTLIQQLDLPEDLKMEPGSIAENIQYWKTHVLGALYEYKKNAKHTSFEINNQKLRKEEELVIVQERVKEKKDEVAKQESKMKRLEEDINMTKNEILTEEQEMQQENDRCHQQIVEARKGHKTSLYQKQYSVDQAKEEMEATKALGKERMRSGAEFLAKVCNRSLEDLEEKTNLAMQYKQDVKNTCRELLEAVKSHHS